MDSHRKSRKHKKDKKKKKRHRSSSSSESSSEDEWVEAQTSTQSSSISKEQNILDAKKESNDDEQWTSFSDQFQTREQMQEKLKPKEEKTSILDQLGRSDRELNPYWKDGGCGLPKEHRDLSVTRSEFGDYGLDWMRRALRRAKEQAADEKRSLQEVVAERWGSLEKLQSMIAEAEKKTGKSSSKYYNSRHDDRFKRRSNHKHNYGNKDASRIEKDQNSSKQRFMKPKDDYSSDDDYEQRKGKHTSKEKNREKEKKSFSKPHDKDGSDNELDKVYRKNEGKYSDCNLSSTRHNSTSGKGWRKPEKEDVLKTKEKVYKCEFVSECDNKDDKDAIQTSNTSSATPNAALVCAPLTADERNELAAKLMKAEIMGNTELANELKSRLEQARASAAAPEKVVLTRTDAKGFTQPLPAPGEPSSSGRKREKVKTHEGGKRVRYFADDDRFTLQEMFEREKRNTVEDQNEMFARLAGKNIGRDESTRDMDDVFEETARVKESDDRSAARARSKAIAEHKRSNQALDNCQWCLDSKALLKHLIVAIGSKVYLCLPPYESLTEGHCLLATSQHVMCSVQADEEVWEEMQVFRKALVDLFLSMDMDVVFFEYAAGFNRFPHTVLQCVPLPKEQGDVAPIYFKKAILECETEWSSNKKLVDLSGRNVRRAVPRGLPYFFVDFGMQPGYAHVIEDEQLFSRNFAQEIIGGMLDVDHSKWRKPRREKFEDQRKKVVAFTKLWKPFDFTKGRNDD